MKLKTARIPKTMRKSFHQWSKMTFFLFWIIFSSATLAKEQDDEEVLASSTPVSRSARELNEDQEEHVEPALAVLFPWFVETVGIVVFFILTRYCKALPYTAVMFLIGTLMGICANRFGSSLDNQMEESILQWQDIDGEVLLLVFLPGLLFRDAFNLNIHLFWQAKEQCLIFAFPMVLAGTVLTACVAYYVFPYNWSFYLAMTFGSILSATDPVAVSALLNELGAPPRLKMHISGESLLNDGSAIVFFSIFKELFLTELNLEGVGQTYSVGEGFSLFFRLALGGVAIGIAFGIGLILLLFLLQRRWNVEENAVQVTATIAVAYLTYYTADVVCGTSGVIATVICGVTVQALGSTMINDPCMLDSFWIMVEHILNTLLFTLGGVVWGSVIANPDDENDEFVAKDWGYLILLYACLVAIRFFLMFAFYPLTSKIGLKSNWKEALFMSYGGLRGAVGIALAISLDNEVLRYASASSHENSEEDTANNYESNSSESILNKYSGQTSKVFGMVGGIALLTLVVNATFSAPLLRKLHLADSPKARQDIVKRYRHALKKYMVDNLINLLTYPRFQQIDFGIVQSHTPLISNLTVNELKVALADHRAQIPLNEYNPPDLHSVLPYLSDLSQQDDMSWLPSISVDDSDKDDKPIRRSSLMMKANEHTATAFRSSIQVNAIEIRKIFIGLLRHSYQAQILDGELDGREGFLSNTLLLSLDFAADAVSKGSPIQDWEEVMKSTSIFEILTNRSKLAMTNVASQVGMMKKSYVKKSSLDSMRLRIRIHGALSCMSAHRWAQDQLRSDYRDIHFGDDYGKDALQTKDQSEDLSVEWKIVLEESQAQFELAKKVVESTNREQVKVISSQLVSTILLNKAAKEVEMVVQSGLLKEQEAEGYLEEFQHSLDCVCNCSNDHDNDSSE